LRSSEPLRDGRFGISVFCESVKVAISSTNNSFGMDSSEIVEFDSENATSKNVLSNNSNNMVIFIVFRIY